ncbi:MAG: O-antigen ligase family protein, partial [Rhodocyclaceae bacterium]
MKDGWLFWGLVGLLFWAPLPLGSNRTWAVGILVVWSQILLIGTLVVWRRSVDGAFARLGLFKVPIALLGAFCLLIWVQLLPLPEAILGALSPETLAVRRGVSDLLLSLDPHQTRIYAALSFGYFSCFLVALLAVRDGKRLEMLAQMLVYAGLLQALIGVFLFSTGASYTFFYFDVVHDRVRGTFGYHNHMAGYMELTLSVGIGLMLARLGNAKMPQGTWRHRLVGVFEFLLSEKMRLRMMLVVLVIALVLTRSRMGNTAFFAAMLIVGVVAIALSRKMAPATIGLIASLIVIDIVVIGAWVGLEKVTERISQTAMTQEAGLKEESVELREDAARHALDLVKDFPAFGTGAGSFYNAYLRYRTPRDGYFDHAHNDYIEIAADDGLIGLGILGLFVAATLAKGVLVLRKRRSSLPRGVAFGTLMAVVALIIHS